MRIHVLGAGAGGGFPQWNCHCRYCAGLRAGAIAARPRTQSSITVSADGERWVLINASPDIRAQIEAFPPLRPGRAVRDTGIAAVLLVDSQIDHATGLLTLREGPRLALYTTAPVQQDLSIGFPVIPMLSHYCGVDWHPIVADGSVFGVSEAPGLSFQAYALSSKAPPYSPHRHDPHPGDNIGLFITDTATGGRLFYAPGLGAFEPHLHEPMSQADVLMVDGTAWRDEDLIDQGAGSKRALEMGHLPQSGPGGMIERLAAFPRARKILIHINNTNPILDDHSRERAILDAAGITVAEDGLDLVL